MYNGKIVNFGVRQLLDHEINYLTHDFKLATVVFVLRIWYYYVQGEKLWICTDHKARVSVFTERGEHENT